MHTDDKNNNNDEINTFGKKILLWTKISYASLLANSEWIA